MHYKGTTQVTLVCDKVDIEKPQFRWFPFLSKRMPLKIQDDTYSWYCYQELSIFIPLKGPWVQNHLIKGGVANEGECSGKKKRSRWVDGEPQISMLANEGECSGNQKRSRWAVEEPQIPIRGQIELPYFTKKLADVDPIVQELSIKLSLINRDFRL